MTNRKNQNSLLVLATLGVYLGLVLAGATPQILAQAATAKQFNVKDEIEAKDDLDTKPNDCDLANLREKVTAYETTFLWFNHRTVREYLSLLEHVYAAYPEKVDAIDISWKSVGDDKPIRKVATALTYPFGFLDEESAQDIDDEVLYVGSALPGKSFNFSVLRNSLGTQFRLESQQVPFDAPLVRTLYSSAIELQKCENWSDENVILRNTELLVERDHLVISTRLARGSLDSLLALNAK